MLWGKLVLALLGLFMLALLLRLVRDVTRVKRRFDDSSAEAAERLQQYLDAKQTEQKNSG